MVGASDRLWAEVPTVARFELDALLLAALRLLLGLESLRLEVDLLVVVEVVAVRTLASFLEDSLSW